MTWAHHDREISNEGLREGVKSGCPNPWQCDITPPVPHSSGYQGTSRLISGSYQDPSEFLMMGDIPPNRGGLGSDPVP